MALDSKPYRRVSPDRFRRSSRRVSLAAGALLAHLSIGRASDPCGIVEIDADMLRVDLCGADPAPLLAELVSAGLIVSDGQTAYIVGWCIDDPPANKSHKIGMERRAQMLATGAVLDAFMLEISGVAYRADTVSTQSQHGVQTVSTSDHRPQTTDHDLLPIGSSAPSVDSAAAKPPNGPRTAATLFDDHTPASDTNRQPRAKRARTVAESPPSREATRTFFERAGSTWAEADQCYDHHEARGWVSGRTPLKNWDAACRTWIANAAKYAMQRRTSGGGNRRPVYDEAAVWTPEAKARAERESTGAF